MFIIARHITQYKLDKKRKELKERGLGRRKEPRVDNNSRFYNDNVSNFSVSNAKLRGSLTENNIEKKYASYAQIILSNAICVTALILALPYFFNLGFIAGPLIPAILIIMQSFLALIDLLIPLGINYCARRCSVLENGGSEHSHNPVKIYNFLEFVTTIMSLVIGILIASEVVTSPLIVGSLLIACASAMWVTMGMAKILVVEAQYQECKLKDKVIIHNGDQKVNASKEDQDTPRLKAQLETRSEGSAREGLNKNDGDQKVNFSKEDQDAPRLKAQLETRSEGSAREGLNKNDSDQKVNITKEDQYAPHLKPHLEGLTRSELKSLRAEELSKNDIKFNKITPLAPAALRNLI